MRNATDLTQTFEDLADRFARENHFRNRDHCFVLAADAALAAGRPEEAERLRQRLLQANPFHMLRPYGSMAEAMQLKDLRDYVEDLRRQWPPEHIEKYQNEAPASPVSISAIRSKPEDRSAAPPPRKTRQVAAPAYDYQPPVAGPGKPFASPSFDDASAPPTPKLARVVIVPGTSHTRSPYEPPMLPPEPSHLATAVPWTQWLATMLFFLGVLLSGGVFFLTFVWPLLD
jgi:hypothetical protein